jgi:hypothetical protein
VGSLKREVKVLLIAILLMMASVKILENAIKLMD